MTFVFSADGHFVEPSDLFSEGLPPSLRTFGLHAVKQDDFILSMAGDKVLQKPPSSVGRHAWGLTGNRSAARTGAATGKSSSVCRTWPSTVSMPRSCSPASA
ncbi:hypothetical protein ACFSLT_22830 [Novosphingobium resinovorum]